MYSIPAGCIVPTPTPEEIADAAAQSADDGIQSVTVDGRTTVAMDPVKQLDVADRLAERSALSGANANGGPVSAWNRTRAARAIPPGGV